MSNSKNEKLIERVSLFNDSAELSKELFSIGDKQRNMRNRHYIKESAAHIEGLFDLTKDLARALKKAMKELDAKGDV